MPSALRIKELRDLNDNVMMSDGALTSNVSFANIGDDSISGDKIHGGTISTSNYIDFIGIPETNYNRMRYYSDGQVFKGNVSSWGYARNSLNIVAGTYWELGNIQITTLLSNSCIIDATLACYNTSGSTKSIQISFGRISNGIAVGFNLFMTGEYPTNEVSSFTCHWSTLSASGLIYQNLCYQIGSMGAGAFTTDGGINPLNWTSSAEISNGGGFTGNISIHLVQYLNQINSITFSLV